MCVQRFTIVSFGFLWLAITGCSHSVNGLSGPDLVPEKRFGSQGQEGFCRLDEGELIVRVRNQSNSDVIENSTTIVTFSTGGARSATTGPMAGGASLDVSFPVPAECFSSDCRFTVQVDANDEIDEHRENNNLAQGICIG